MNPKIIKVRTKPPYQILIQNGLLQNLSQDLAQHLSFGKVAIITDSTVEKLYGKTVLENLQRQNISAQLFSFPAGEASKHIFTVQDLARSLVQANFDRKDLILALGGGVVGDVAGFLASIYLRGIPFVQVPTTLLAQVDSSVGGKTGVDLPEGKNLLGTFYQPVRVYIDPEVLKTLPSVELKNGLAEVIKYACTLKPRLFSYLARNSAKILACEERALQWIISESCQAKAWVVSRDEKESGLRRVLNFGHTIGHALEALANYQKPHGFCVAVGMVVSARLSENLNLAQAGLSQKIVALLQTFGLPTKISELDLNPEPEAIFTLIQRDKKVWKGKLTMVLLKDLGQYVFYENPPFSALKLALTQTL